ncbi:MAG: molybdopterin-dependent oxidoreductase, partial [Eggerthella lenta]
MTMNESSVSRRTFVKGSLAGLALAGAAGSTALYGCAPKDEKGAASEGAGASTDQISWSQCNVNCGGNCVFQWHSQDGKIVYMESDNTGDVDLQARACLRGRSMRRWINSPDRLTKPMKRVGKRGEGKFEEISWDEAIDTIASELKRVIDTYGNEAIYVNYATGMYSTTGKQPGLRLLGLLGGYINQAYDYSTHMLQVALPFMYGSKCSPYDNVHASSFSEAERASDLVVMFGNSPAETRMGGANAVWDFAKVRESVTGRGGKIVNIDYRMNESCSGHPDEWLPIRPGTDAALASAIAHEWIANDQVDKGFLDEYCVGYDEGTMPESAKGQNKSYKDYIM